jgi:hypothetical protein
MAASKAKAIASVERRIVGIEEADPYVKLLAYGRNGSGKTRLVAGAPELLLIDVNEKGTTSARQFKGVKVFHAKSWADIVYSYWYLKEGNHPYKSVSIDTTTMMQKACIKQVLKEGEDRDPSKDPKSMSQREWGKVAELMGEMLLNFRNLDMHVLFTAQERTVDDPDEETRERVPDLSPGSRGTLTSCVGIIGRVYKKEVRTVDAKRKKEVSKWETRMLVGPSDEFITKDRTGQLGRIMRNPTMAQIIAAWGSNNG